MLDIPAAQALRAADCKARFAVFGLFHDMPLDGSLWSCRSILELVAHDRVPAEDAGALLDRRPDLLVVMMNPGGSRPIPKGFTPPRLTGPAEVAHLRTLVPTVPDTTQYQVMKVMAARGWQHARVLNLSDLRESKSPLLFQHLRRLAEAGGTAADAHSIFSPGRRAELLSRIGPVEGSPPVILGWGRHKALTPLADLCLGALAGRVTVGVQAPEGPLSYAHPSPQLQALKDAWIERILGLLEARGV